MSMLPPLPFQLFANPRAGRPAEDVLSEAGFAEAQREITSWPGYAPTPLVDLPWVAGPAGLGAVRMKDESGRFGLGSFKALGGAYAVARLLIAGLAKRGIAATSAELAAGRFADATRTVTVTTATDGNHGRAVAWGAQRFHCRAVIFIHAAVSEGRAAAIARYGAEVRRVQGTYDDAVREAARVAAAEGWFVVSDTSWPGYSEVPANVMQGYRVMVAEALDQWEGAPPTHAFVQGGVGAVVAAVGLHLRTRLDPPPALVAVEPERAACLLASAELGEPTAVVGNLDSVMAGLVCGEPSPLAWRELDRGAAAFMAIPDAAAVGALQLLAAHGLTIGESGVAGLAALLLAAGDPAARAALGLGPASRVLLFGTEGATDPELYARLLASPAG
jgi:diaminopropionate ammonia-lyase